MSNWFSDLSKNSKAANQSEKAKMKENLQKLKEKIHKKRDVIKKIFKQSEVEEAKEVCHNTKPQDHLFKEKTEPPQGEKETETENELLLCPISQELMTDPVMTPYGHCFQRSCIEAWLVEHNTCPITGQALSSDQLIPCFTVKAIVEEHLAKHKSD